MRSVVVHGPRDTRIVEESEPALASGRLKVRLRYSSVVMENVGLHTGAGRIVVADLYPPRLEVARRLGATHTINPRETNLAAAVKEITEGNGPDVVFDAGNTAATFPLALELARPQGKVVVLSWHTQP